MRRTWPIFAAAVVAVVWLASAVVLPPRRAVATPVAVDPTFADGRSLVLPGTWREETVLVERPGGVAAIGISTPEGGCCPMVRVVEATADGRIERDLRLEESAAVVGSPPARLFTAVRRSGGGYLISGLGVAEAWVLAVDSSGGIDRSFGVGGWLVDPPAFGPGPLSLTVDAIGRVLVGTATFNAVVGGTASVCRFGADGRRDATFGVGGCSAVDDRTVATGGIAVRVTALASFGDRVMVVLTNARYFMAGARYQDATVMALGSDGLFDTGFGSGGRSELEVLVNELVGDLDAGPAGSLYVLRGTQLSRVRSDGLYDPTFGGGDGRVELPAVGGVPLQGLRLAVRGGDLVVSGRSDGPASARLAPDGTVLPGFGTDGVAVALAGLAGGPIDTVVTEDGRAVALVHTSGRLALVGYRLAPLGTLAAPSGLVLTPLDGEVQARWDAVAGATGYEVRASGAHASTKHVGATTRTALLPAPNGTPVTVSVVAFSDGVVSPAATATVTPAPGPLARTVMLPAPTRVLDTRLPNRQPPVGPGVLRTVALRGAHGIPANATAVVANVTITEASAPGYVTAWPAGTPVPTVSTLNAERVGQTVANLTVVPLGATGAVSLVTQSGGHLVVDVLAYLEPVASSSRGRIAAADTRLVDTRTGGGSPVAPGGTLRVPVLGASGVPAGGAAAAVVTVTMTETTGPGFVTAWSGEAPRPDASTLNVERAGQTIPNLAFVPIAADGSIGVYTQGGGHVVVDLVGTVTDATAADDTRGLLQVVPPTRIVDTRHRPAPVPASGALWLTEADGCLMNLTITNTVGTGFLAFASSFAAVRTSATNATEVGQTFASAALSTGYTLLSQPETDVVVDLLACLAT